jgi:hypothetical protein
MPSRKGHVSLSSTMAADIVSVGDSWLNLAINKAIIEPIQGAEDQEWFKALSDKWKVRNTSNRSCLCRWTCALSQTYTSSDFRSTFFVSVLHLSENLQSSYLEFTGHQTTSF